MGEGYSMTFSSWPQVEHDRAREQLRRREVGILTYLAAKAPNWTRVLRRSSGWNNAVLRVPLTAPLAKLSTNFYG